MKFGNLRSFPLQRPEDESGGGGGTAPAPAPVADTPAPAPADAPAPAPADAPAPAPAPAEPFAGLDKLLDQVGADPEAKPPAEPPAAPTPAPAANAPAPKPEAVDLTPPDGMTDRAKERWGQLTERAKLVPELERRATESETALTSVRKMVADSGLAADEFTEMLTMGRLLKSDTPADLQKAMARLDNIRAGIATRLGVDAPGVDVLAAHADLKAKVEAMTLTKEDALEIAKLRTKGAQADNQTQEQREQQQFRQTVQQAAAKMETTLAQRASTPGHEAKVAHIMAHFKDPAKLNAFVTTYQPQQWESVVLMMYDSHVPAAPAAPAVQPLRPGNTRPGAAVSSGHVTAESAVEGAFARLNL